MANTKYERMDKAATQYLVNYLLQVLKDSPLADNTTYSITLNAETKKYELKDQIGTVVSTFQIPTNNNELTNGAGYATETQVSTMIANAIGGVTSIDFEVVTELPATGVKGKFYLIAHTHGDKDIYDEYLWIGDKFEKVGNTDIDLTGYVKKEEMAALTNDEVKAIVDAAYAEVFTA